MLPLGLLGISSLFEQDTTGFDVLGNVIVVILFFIGAFITYWWMYRGGRDKTVERVQARQKRAEAVRTLPDELESLRAEIAALKEHTGLRKGVEDDGDEEEEQFKEKDEENMAA